MESIKKLYFIFTFIVFSLLFCSCAKQKAIEKLPSDDIFSSVRLLEELTPKVIGYYEQEFSFPMGLNQLGVDLKSKGFLVSAKAAVLPDDSLKIILENAKRPLSILVKSRDVNNKEQWVLEYQLNLTKDNKLEAGPRFFYITSQDKDKIYNLNKVAQSFDWEISSQNSYKIK